MSDENIEQQFYEDPAGFLKSYAAKIKQEVTQELSGAYRREKASDEYWRGFGEDRPDLKGHSAEAREILSRHEADWAKEGITVGESYDRLAEALDDGMALRDAQKRAGSGPGAQVVVSRKGRSEVVAANGERIPTLSQAIRDRQAKFSLPEKARQNRRATD
ncbi:MAG: hypothetical protein L0312_04115 [Acidobacteria bacterium]|nr:hypothetical protein [Acidobacteriota bacterium]